jgi:hypothetical protein
VAILARSDNRHAPLTQKCLGVTPRKFASRNAFCSCAFLALQSGTLVAIAANNRL